MPRLVPGHNGLVLSYERSGEGAPTVLLHAFPFDSRFWQDTAEHPALAGNTIIRPDLRGFGDSEMADAPHSIVDMADDVATLIDRLELGRVVLGGLSMGGYVALAFAARHPERLRGLVLADTKAGPDNAQGKAGRDAGMAAIEAGGLTPFEDTMLPKLLAPNAPKETQIKARHLMTHRRDGVLGAIVAMRDRPDRSKSLATIRVPTLILVGQEDTLTPVAEAESLAKAIATSEMIVIPGAGHLVNLEQPEGVAAAIGHFVSKLPPQ